MKILVIEDEQKTVTYLRKGLSENGFAVDLAGDGEDGLHLAATGQYELIVLDVMLPGRDGWSVLSELAAVETNAAPVLDSSGSRSGPRSRARARSRRLSDQAVRVFRALGPHPVRAASWPDATARHPTDGRPCRRPHSYEERHALDPSSS